MPAVAAVRPTLACDKAGAGPRSQLVMVVPKKSMLENNGKMAESRGNHGKIWGFPQMEISKNGCFIMGNPNYKWMMTWGTPILGNLHVSSGRSSLIFYTWSIHGVYMVIPESKSLDLIWVYNSFFTMAHGKCIQFFQRRMGPWGQQ